MAFHDFARLGYLRTLSGTWDLGDGERLTFLVEDAGARRCELVVLARSTVLTALTAPAGATQRIAATLVEAVTHVAATVDLEGVFVRVQHPAFGLGGPAEPSAEPFAERRLATFRESMVAREGIDGAPLTWIADCCQRVLEARPYFAGSETEAPWWEAGVLVVPVPDESGGYAEAPLRCLVLCARTDVPGTLLGLSVLTIDEGVVTAQAEGVFERADADLPASAELDAR